MINKHRSQENFAKICATGELTQLNIQGTESLMYGLFAAVKSENYKNLEKILPIALEKNIKILEPSFNLAFEYFEAGDNKRIQFLDNNDFLKKALLEDIDWSGDISQSMRELSAQEKEIACYRGSILPHNLKPKSLSYIINKNLDIHPKQIERAFIKSIKNLEVTFLLLESNLDIIKNSNLVHIYLSRDSPNNIIVKQWLKNMKLSQKLNNELDEKCKNKKVKI